MNPKWIALSSAVLATLLVAGCGATRVSPSASPSRSFTEAEAFRQYREVFPTSPLTDAQLREAGQNMCKDLAGGMTPQGIVDDGNAKNGATPDQELLRQIWGVIFTGVLVYCPEYQGQLPTKRPY